jgi:RNA polymerase sigma factor (sigma-70 family)
VRARVAQDSPWRKSAIPPRSVRRGRLRRYPKVPVLLALAAAAPDPGPPQLPSVWQFGARLRAVPLAEGPVNALDEASSQLLVHERRLVERAQAGDRKALGELLGLHGPRLYRAVLLPRLGSAAAAEEALSVTYLKVVERFGQFAWQAVGVYPWLRVVALRVALDQLRARKRETVFKPEDLEREIEESESGAEEAARSEAEELAVAKQRVLVLIQRLHPRYARALTLRILEERPREECAAALEVTTATFDVVLHRAVAAMKKELSREGR